MSDQQPTGPDPQRADEQEATGGRTRGFSRRRLVAGTGLAGMLGIAGFGGAADFTGLVRGVSSSGIGLRGRVAGRGGLGVGLGDAALGLLHPLLGLFQGLALADDLVIHFAD